MIASPDRHPQSLSAVRIAGRWKAAATDGQTSADGAGDTREAAVAAALQKLHPAAPDRLVSENPTSR